MSGKTQRKGSQKAGQKASSPQKAVAASGLNESGKDNEPKKETAVPPAKTVTAPWADPRKDASKTSKDLSSSSKDLDRTTKDMGGQESNNEFSGKESVASPKSDNSRKKKREAPACEACGASFGVTRPRERCQLCGQVVCGPCAPYEEVPGYTGKVRACVNCTGVAAEGPRGGVSKLLQPASTVTDRVANTLSSLSMDKEYMAGAAAERERQPTHIGHGLLAGAASLGKGLFQGVTGIVVEPVKGASKDGLKGFGKGVVRGITGVVVKPAVGALTMASMTIKGAGNTAGYFKDQLIGSSPKSSYGDHVPEHVNHGKKLTAISAAMRQKLSMGGEEEILYHAPNMGHKTQVVQFATQTADDGTSDCLILTNKRFIHVSHKEIKQNLQLDSVTSSFHQAFNYKYDILVIKTKAGQNSVRVHSKEVCAFFNQKLQEVIGKRKLRTPFIIRRPRGGELSPKGGKLPNSMLSGVEMPAEMNHGGSGATGTNVNAQFKKISQTLIEQRILSLIADEELLCHCINLSKAHPKRAQPNIRYSLSECVLLTNRRVVFLEGSQISTVVWRYMLARVDLERGDSNRLLFSLVDGTVVTVVVHSHQLRRFLTSTLMEGEAARREALLDMELSSPGRALDLKDSRTVYVMCCSQDPLLVLDHRPVRYPDGSVDPTGARELVLAAVTGMQTQKWRVTHISSGVKELRPVLCPMTEEEQPGAASADAAGGKVKRGSVTGKGVSSSDAKGKKDGKRSGKDEQQEEPEDNSSEISQWVKDQVWIYDEKRSSILCQGTEKYVTIQGLCCGEGECEKNRLRAGDLLCMAPLAGKDSHDNPKPSSLQKWRLASDFEVFIEDLVTPVGTALLEYEAMMQNQHGRTLDGALPEEANNFEAVWVSKGDLHSLTAFGVWQPKVPPGYIFFGHSIQVGTDPPKQPALICKNDPAPFAHPKRYERVWKYGGEHDELHVWLPIPHSEAYAALGCVCTRVVSGKDPNGKDAQPPPLTLVSVVHRDYLRPADRLQQFCTVEPSSSATTAVSIWNVPRMGTFWLQNNPISRPEPSRTGSEHVGSEESVTGVHLPPQNLALRFPPNPSELKLTVETLEKRGIELMDEASRYLNDIVDELVATSPEDKNTLNLHFEYIRQLLVAIQDFVEYDSRENLVTAGQGRRHMETIKGKVDAVCRVVKRFIYTTLDQEESPTLEDAVVGLQGLWQLVDSLPPVDWPETVSWNFPANPSEAEKKMMEKSIANPPPVESTFRDLLRGTLVTKIGKFERAKPSNKPGGPRAVEDIDPSRGRHSNFDDVFAMLDYDNSLKACIKLVKLTYGDTLDKGIATTIGNEFMKFIRKTFDKYVSFKDLAVVQAAKCISWLQNYKALLIKTLEIPPAQVREHPLIAPLDFYVAQCSIAYSASAKRKLLSFADNTLSQETVDGAANLQQRRKYYFTEGSSELVEHITDALELSCQQKLGQDTLVALASTYQRILLYYLELFKFALRGFVVQDDCLNLSLPSDHAGIQIALSKTVPAPKGVVPTQNVVVPHTWFFAQLNNIKEFCTNTEGLRDRIVDALNEGYDADEETTKGVEIMFDLVLQQIRGLVPRILEGLTKVLRKRAHFSLRDNFTAGWISVKQFVDANHGRYFSETRTFVDALEQEDMRSAMADRVMQVYISEYCNLFSERAGQITKQKEKEQMFAHIQADVDMIRKLNFCGDCSTSVKAAASRDIDTLTWLNEIYTVDPDFLSLLTPKVVKRFAGDIVHPKKMIATALGLRDDVNGKVLASQISYEPVPEKSWKLSVSVLQARDIAFNDAGLSCAVSLLDCGSRLLGKRKTDVIINSVNPEWDQVVSLTAFATGAVPAPGAGGPGVPLLPASTAGLTAALGWPDAVLFEVLHERLTSTDIMGKGTVALEQIAESMLFEQPVEDATDAVKVSGPGRSRKVSAGWTGMDGTSPIDVFLSGGATNPLQSGGASSSSGKQSQHPKFPRLRCRIKYWESDKDDEPKPAETHRRGSRSQSPGPGPGPLASNPLSSTTGNSLSVPLSSTSTSTSNQAATSIKNLFASFRSRQRE